MANSRELVALSSLAYNNPALIGPGLSAALHSGAREKAWFEILFCSNRARHRGLQKRRNHEAKMFGLTNAQPSKAERAAIVDFLKEKRPIMMRYMEDFGFSEPDIEATLADLSDSVGDAVVHEDAALRLSWRVLPAIQQDGRPASGAFDAAFHSDIPNHSRSTG